MAGPGSEIAKTGPQDPAQADRPLPAGTVIDGRYRVVAELGAGGMGRVYEAEHMFIRRRIALKLLRGGPATGPEAAARLVQEATLAGQVPHPAVVRVFDCAVLGAGQVYLAMELLRGESLEQALRRPATAAEIVPRLIEVARGLAAVHRVGVVHRDIKPANIFLATSEAGVHAKLLDFGVAKLLPGASGMMMDAVKTQAGAVLGTPYYLAPEQARGAALDGRADLYSVGVILYEVLTGTLPFVGERYMDILAQHIRTPPLDPRQAAPGRRIPDALARLTMGLLAKEPAARPADGDALAEALAGILERDGEALRRLVTGPEVRETGVSAEAGTVEVAEAGTMRLSRGTGVERLSEGTGAGEDALSERTGAVAGELSERTGRRSGREGMGRRVWWSVVVAAVVVAVGLGWVAGRARPGVAGGSAGVGGQTVGSPAAPAAVVVPVMPAPARPEVASTAPEGSTGAEEAGAEGQVAPVPRAARAADRGKKRPLEGGTTGAPRPPPTARDPQLKPDVYDE